MKLKQILLFMLLFVAIGNSYGAFPIKPDTTLIATNVLQANEIYNAAATNSDTIYQKTTYRNQYHKPYHNREKEANLAFTFGLLGLLLFAPLGIPALILGISSADRRNKKYSHAVAGLVMGAVSTLEIIVIIALVLALAI